MFFSMLHRALLCLLVTAHGFLLFSEGHTDSADVSSLNNIYSSLNSPSQLSGWKSGGGDPCGENWEGITCSGSSVTEIKLSGLGLSGSMGYQMSSLASLTYLDLSKNNLQGNLPYQLPPNANHINLAQNSFNGGIPYSISQMTNLEYLNLAHNQLNGQLTDVFGKLSKLTLLDLSFNQISGNLPQSFGSLSNLKTLYLQNNQFTGHISVLSKIPLDNLNIQNNQFSGWIPEKMKDLNNFEANGNSWSSGPAPPGSTQDNSVNKSKSQAGINGAVIAGALLAFFLVALVGIGLVKKRSSPTSNYIDDQFSQNRSFAPLVSNEFKDLKSVDSSATIDMPMPSQSPPLNLKPLSSDYLKSFNDISNSPRNTKATPDAIGVMAYSLVDLQAATGSFGSSYLVGEGSIGRVYKAKFSDGKVLAVKKLDPSKLPEGRFGLHNFAEIVSGIAQLRHMNIAELVGYCSEPTNCFLVYDFQRNGSLHEFLHMSDEYSKPLTWDTRVRIALGTARAVEYLHEACSPPSIHKNIKSANILLNAELNPLLADCGLASFYLHTEMNLGEGYNSPECTKSSAYTIKSDVYSFGVVMLELLTGRKPFDRSKPKAKQSLVRWARPQLHDINSLSQMVDPALRGLYPPKSLSRFADTVSLCIQAEPEFRPPMSEVVLALVQCGQRAPFGNKRTTGDPKSASQRSDYSEDSDYYY